MVPHEISRRSSLKLITAGAAAGIAGGLSAQGSDAKPANDRWAMRHDRVWLSGDVWANPMEDWCIKNGSAECLSTGTGRSVHSLTHQITANKPFRMSVQLRRIDAHKNDGGAGFRIGLQSEIKDHRADCFVSNGITAGWQPGKLTLGKKSVKIPEDIKSIQLVINGTPEGEDSKLTLTAMSATGDRTHAGIEDNVFAADIMGNVSLCHHLSSKVGKGRGKDAAGARYSFYDWTMQGEAFAVKPERQFGPLLWTMYSLSDSRSDEGFVLKLSAVTGPMGEKDSKEVELLVQEDGKWKSLGMAPLDPDAWVATFRIPNWDASKSVTFKTLYHEQLSNGKTVPHEWTGTIRANPTKPLRMAGLTCQNDYGFPYAPVADNLVKLDPDLLFFSGDQIYEAHGGFGIIRTPAEPAILNFLRKQYQFGWAFREAMRHAPTLCLPDDHDVFQGNIWGEGGAKMKGGDTSSLGGYIEPVRMVEVVHKINCGHHPDPYDPTPIKQDMSVYYGNMVYGNVSFAIIADRQWKTGPEAVDTGGGRQDHVPDKDFDTSTLDKPGLVLLGERQEKFLEAWAKDWRGHQLKAVLSQTVFAGMATHHGGPNGYLKADLDSGGWPQTARNRAIEIIRPAMALHINGDQHLGSLSQYGVEKQRDSNWAFCTPAISAGYPRWWRPDEVGMPHANRPEHGLPHTGEYEDGLGNKVYVYAVENPKVGKAPNRYDKAHEKGSGFGMITFDTDKKTYHIEAFRFLIDATDGKPANQFTGWPVTIHRDENKGINRLK